MAFYPSSSVGDDIDNKKVILQSCSYNNKISITNPTGLTNDTNSRPLIFYMRDHAKCPTHLAAHRALILGRLWEQTPSNLKLLNNAVATLHLLLDTFYEFSLPIMIEFYQSWIRTVCQSMICGPLEVHGGLDETMLSLIDDVTWRYDFLTSAKKVLSLIVKCAKKRESPRNSPAKTVCKKTSNQEVSVNPNRNQLTLVTDGKKFDIADMWPPLQDE